jgi:NAD(P)-dependent dehydrogenase (short-subunit alcohol dehydrogenase family)
MLPADYDVTGKVVLITGAGRGIGKGIAQVLAEAGADIALNALTPRYVAGVAAEIAAASGRRVVPVLADATQPDAVRGMVDTVLQTFGRIDVLVNALGDSIRKPLVTLPGRADSAPGVTDDELRFILDVNLTEALLCTRAVGPHMLERRSGKVISIASWTAHSGGRDIVLYTAAKTALAGFTRALALEWAPYGVQVNAISPGLFPDAVTSGEEGVRRAGERAQQMVPLGRTGQLREVGLLALYLASAASDYMTGQTIPLDGGLGL